MVIKALIDYNPLSDCGNIVKKERFVGRIKEIEVIKNRVLSKNSGNIAVMGLPRVGKSSLVWNALLLENFENFIIIYVNVGSIESSDEFFNILINKVFSEIEFLNNFNQKQLEILSKLKNKIFDTKINLEKKEYIEKFFKFLTKTNLYFVYVLDEFDHVASIFKLENFQFLRELAIKPNINLSFVTISRRTIEEIELLNLDALSKLAGIFSYLNLGLFTKEEFNLYWKRLKSLGIDTDEEYQNKVYYYTGYYPYLIDLFNYEVINEILIEKNINIMEVISNKIQLNFYHHYDHIINLLKEEKLYDKLIQVLIGPIYDLDQKSIEKLEKFGLINKINGKYQCFSQFFYEYIQLKQNEIDFWPLWSETETKIREVIKIYIDDKFGKNWEVKFIEKFPKKKDALERLKKTRDKNKRTFKEKASDHLVDYTYPADMFEIFISSDWGYYQNIFQGQKKDWKQIFDHLAKIRNPIAHNNSYFLNSSDKNLAISYCEKILNNIKD